MHHPLALCQTARIISLTLIVNDANETVFTVHDVLVVDRDRQLTLKHLSIASKRQRSIHTQQ